MIWINRLPAQSGMYWEPFRWSTASFTGTVRALPRHSLRSELNHCGKR